MSPETKIKVPFLKTGAFLVQSGRISLRKYESCSVCGLRAIAAIPASVRPRTTCIEATWATRSRQRLRHQVPRHIGQPEVTSLELEGQLLVVHAHAMENGSLQIVYVHR